MKYTIIKPWLLQAELKIAVDENENQFLEVFNRLLHDRTIIDFNSYDEIEESNISLRVKIKTRLHEIVNLVNKIE